MDILKIILQVIVAGGLLNVWLLRFKKSTSYRGGNAQSLPEEFSAYGLPRWFMWIVGALKIAVAVAMIAGIWIPGIVTPAAGLLVILMLGAFLMHVKVKDPIRRSIPSLVMLALAIALILL